MAVETLHRPEAEDRTDQTNQEDLTPAPLAPIPMDELAGMEEFGTTSNWISFDAQRGKLTCKNLNTEYEESIGIIIGSRVVRVMSDEEGAFFCGSSDRITADRGRPGRLCETCEDREVSCDKRWQLAWQEDESGMLFAHTLSHTASVNFMHYANALVKDGLTPSQVITRIYIEDAKRVKTRTVYRRLQFARVDPFADAPA